MNEKEQNLPEPEELDLEDILKEFGDGLDTEVRAEPDVPPTLESLFDEEPEHSDAPQAESAVSDDTIRLEIPDDPDALPQQRDINLTSDTIRLDQLNFAKPAEDVEEAEAVEAPEEAEETEAAEPEEVTPPEPIVFDPRARLRELKRKLVAGPEKRYYELTEVGVGKLQMAMFLCLIVVAVSAGASVLYSMDRIPENRMRLMIFGQVLAMLLGALLGSYQMLDGLGSLFRGKFTANTLLALTFLACCADSVFCLREQRVPLCAAFTLEVMMSLWSTYHRRTTEMGMMDTMRKSLHLDGVVRCPDYYNGLSAIMRREGEVEDFMDTYQQVSGPEKVQNVYALLALLLSSGIAVAAGLLHGPSVGVQVLSTTLLVAMPASFFIALTRPMAILERRLHSVGTVLCGWKGVLGLSRKCVYPLNDADLFPTGSVRMNGVKFYGDRNPDTVIAYAAALMRANGGSLAPIFDQLLNSRNGIRFTAENLQFYGNGGIGGEINGDPVLMGTLDFLKEMGVEIPDGTMVRQAVYVSVDGDLSGLFAITYNRSKQAAAGMATLSSSRSIRPVIIAKDFLLTAPFLKDTFGLRPRRTLFPSRLESLALESRQPDADAPALALTTHEGLACVAYAITGSRALRTACRLGLTVHLIGGILGMLIMAALAVLGSTALLTPLHILLYQLVWLIPGYIVTMFTRAI